MVDPGELHDFQAGTFRQANGQFPGRYTLCFDDVRSYNRDRLRRYLLQIYTSQARKGTGYLFLVLFMTERANRLGPRDLKRLCANGDHCNE
jgi:hypothetical protein